MLQIVQIGAGLVGQVIVEDLLEDFEVTVVDPNPKALEKLKRKVPSDNHRGGLGNGCCGVAEDS